MHPAAIQDKLDLCRKQAGVPGAAVGYLFEGIITLATSGVGKAGATPLIRRDSIFEAASLSKQILAHVVLRMVDAGTFDLEARALSLVNPAKLAESYWRSFAKIEGFSNISVRTILSHCTGLPNWPPLEGINKLLFGPGTYFQYSGLAYVFLQWILEQRLQKSWQEIATEYVFAPLHMTHSGFAWQDTWEDDLVHGHTANGDAAEKTRNVPGETAGALLTSVFDYSIFLRDLLERMTDSRSAFAQMALPQISRFHGSDREWPIAWGVGIGIELYRDRVFVWQHGANPYFYNWLIANPKTQEGIVIFSNAEPGHSLLRTYVESVLGEGHRCFDFDECYLKQNS
jgi:CubicO group peptidase (beta-lactamase class C family)